MNSPPARQARADAIRNRISILESAKQQIAAHGPHIGMDEIASTAGVAVGTLYRHFPTKSDLVAAVIGEFVAQVADDAEAAVHRVNGGNQAFAELAELLRSVFRDAITNNSIKAAAAALNTHVDDSVNVQRAHAALESLINAAQADGAVRSDLSIDDFYLIAGNAPNNQSPAVLDRWVDLTLFGITGAAPQ